MNLFQNYVIVNSIHSLAKNRALCRNDSGIAFSSSTLVFPEYLSNASSFAGIGSEPKSIDDGLDSVPEFLAFRENV
ncbi:hypothetical protein B1J94_13385 [Leptospira kirschneri serovar Grippotyphosa]|nr:hypothetical protein AYB32_03765 [Leptospira kirschneri]OOV48039.1 hypothetical protein B1J94_13385 [Leptospira kirschneri serovar Grippotyphosa]